MSGRKRKGSKPQLSPSPPPWALAFVLLGGILLGILIMAALDEPEGPQIKSSEVEIREVIGSTPAERLESRGIDATAAKITEITQVERFRERYSGIFKDAEDGMYLVELPGRLLVYDFEHDRIIEDFRYDHLQIN